MLHFESIGEVIKALQEFYRILKIKGVLHILVKAQTGKEKIAIVSDSLSGHDGFFQYFTIPELESLLEKTGFEKITIEQYKETDRNPNGRPEVEVEWILAYPEKLAEVQNGGRIYKV